MSLFVETTKPKSIAMTTQPLYYMCANSHTFKDGIPRYLEITTNEELEDACTVYYKLQDDTDLLEHYYG